MLSLKLGRFIVGLTKRAQNFQFFVFNIFFIGLFFTVSFFFHWWFFFQVCDGLFCKNLGFDLFRFVSREANDTSPSGVSFDKLWSSWLSFSSNRLLSPDKLSHKCDFNGLVFTYESSQDKYLRLSSLSLILLTAEDEVPDRNFFFKSLLALK